MAAMYVAVRDELIRADGVLQTIKAGQTLVSEDSDAYRSYPDLFERYDVERGVEQATAAPGEERNITLEPDDGEDGEEEEE